MNRAQTLFLQCVRDGLHPAPAGAAQKPGAPSALAKAASACSEDELVQALKMAEEQKLGALTLDRLLRANAPLPRETVKKAREAAVAAAVRQQVQENELLDLLLALRAEGVAPLVVKGAVCRSLYPQPLLRPSVDEDLFLSRADLVRADALLRGLGLTPDQPDASPETAYELSYHRPDSPTYLELHAALLDPDSPVFGPCNAFFDGSLDRAVELQIQDVTVRTLHPTDHLLFLLLHAYKHFLHSGFGIRLIADLCLFTEHFSDQIDHAAVFSACQSLRCEEFAAACYRIGQNWLGFEVPTVWQIDNVDETPLLEDILAAGLHGNVSLDRLHSSTITLKTVAAARRGAQSSRGLRHALFPAAADLQGRYRYLQKRPWLLPMAWVQRMFGYARELGHQSNPSVSLRIGRERVRLLQRYHIIDETEDRDS